MPITLIAFTYLRYFIGSAAGIHSPNLEGFRPSDVCEVEEVEEVLEGVGEWGRRRGAVEEGALLLLLLPAVEVGAVDEVVEVAVVLLMVLPEVR